jgi:hypothetical protein
LSCCEKVALFGFGAKQTAPLIRVTRTVAIRNNDVVAPLIAAMYADKKREGTHETK